MSSGENDCLVQQQHFSLSDQLHLQPQDKLQPPQRHQNQNHLQYPLETLHNGQSRQVLQQQQYLLQNQGEQHSQKQQPSFFEKQMDASQEQQHLQDQWQTQMLWQLRHEMPAAVQSNLPASPEKQDQPLPNPLLPQKQKQQQQQPQSSLSTPESRENTLLYSGEGFVVTSALDQQKAKQERRMSWQHQHQYQEASWRQPQVQVDTVPQPSLQKRLYQPLQQSLGSSAAGQQHASEAERVYPSMSLQECQLHVVSQQHQRDFHGEDFFSAPHKQQQQHAALECGNQQQRQPGCLTCMAQLSPDYSAKEQRQQQSNRVQQQQYHETWPEHQQLQQRQVETDFGQQQQHQGNGCTAQLYLPAATTAHNRMQGTAGQQLQPLAVDTTSSPVRVAQAHTTQNDLAAFPSKQEQQQQQQQQQSSGILYRQQVGNCLPLVDQQQHCEPTKQKQLLLDVPLTEPLTVLESYEQQQLVMKQQPTPEHNSAVRQQQPTCQQRERECLPDKDACAANASATATSAGSGESPGSPRNLPSTMTVDVLESQEASFPEQQRQEMKRQLVQQIPQMRQASVYPEQQQKLQLQLLASQEERQMHLSQLQATLHNEPLQPQAAPVQLLQQQQPYLQQKKKGQDLEQHSQNKMGDICSPSTFLKSLNSVGVDIGMPAHAADNSQELQDVHFLPTADSLIKSAGDNILLHRSDSSMYLDCSSIHRNSLYTPYKGGAGVTVTDIVSCIPAVKTGNHSTSTCPHSETSHDNNRDAHTSTDSHRQTNLSNESNARSSSLARSNEVSSKRCEGIEGKMKSRPESVENSREGMSSKYSATAPCIGAACSRSSSASDASFSPAEFVVQRAASSAAFSHGLKTNVRGEIRGGCERRAKIPCELLSQEDAAHSSRKSSSRSRSCSGSSGRQRREMKSRNASCERDSYTRESGQSFSCSEAIESDQCCSSRRRYRCQTRNCSTSSHTSHDDCLSPHSHKRSTSYCDNPPISTGQSRNSSKRSRNSRHGRIRRYTSKGTNMLDRTGNSYTLSGTGRCRSYSSNSVSASSSLGEEVGLLAVGDSKSQRRGGEMTSKVTLWGSRNSGSSNRRMRDLSGSGLENDESVRDSSGDSGKAAIIMRNFNMLVDALTGEDEKKNDDVALRISEKGQCLHRREMQLRGRYRREQQQEEQLHQHQTERHHSREQGQRPQEVQRYSTHDDQDYVARESGAHSTEGVWEKESVALQVLDPYCGHFSPSRPARPSSGGSRRSLVRLTGIDSMSSDSSYTGDGNRSNRGSRKSNSDSDDSDCVAATSNKTVSCLHEGTNTTDSSKGDLTSSRGREERRMSGSGVCQKRCFLTRRRLQDGKSNRTAATECPDITKQKQTGDNSSARRRSEDERTVATKTSRDLFSGDVLSSKSGCSAVLFENLSMAGGQQQHSSSSNTTDKVTCTTTTYRRRGANSSCDTPSLNQQQSDFNRIVNKFDVSDTPLTENLITCEKEFQGRQLRSSSGCRSSRAVQVQQQQQRGGGGGAESRRHSSEAEEEEEEEEKEKEEEQKLSRCKRWAYKTLDLLPDAWIGEQFNAVTMMRQRCSPTNTCSTTCSRSDGSSRFSQKRYNGSRKCVRVSSDDAEAEMSSPALPASSASATGATTSTVGGTSTKERNTSGILSAVITRAGKPEAASEEFYLEEAWDARSFTVAAASPAAISAELDASATVAEDMRETTNLLQGYTRGEGASPAQAAAVAVARKTRQAYVQAAIRQQLLQQYSSMLQQLQQHKAEARLVQDESEPLRAALVHIVAAEAQLRKLQRSERWRVHVGALIHDADNDLMKFMVNFGSAADTICSPVKKKATSFSQSGPHGRRKRNVFSLEEVIAAEEEQQDEEDGEDTDREYITEAHTQETSLSGVAGFIASLVGLLVRDSSRNTPSTVTSGIGRKTRKNGAESTTINRSRTTLLLKLFLGYILLCGSVFLWLRHTVHQL